VQNVIKNSFSGLVSLDFSPSNLGAVSNEHGKRFSAWKSNIRASGDPEYCLILSRDAQEAKYKRESSVATF
jgi:hypothetical protein